MMKNLINRTANHKPKHFIAPALSTHTNVFVVQDNIPYRFDVEVEIPGWYFFRPKKKARIAVTVRNAHPHEYINYKNALPSIYVIALFPITESTWLVMPYNASDAEQRGWKNGTPRSMYLTLDNISSMDVVKTCLLSNSVIFNHLSSINGGNTKEIRIAKDIVDKRLEVIRAQEAKQEAENARSNRLKTEQGRLEESLTFMGAELEDWTRNIEGYTVRWKIDGQVYKMNINSNMRLRSAGVCLSGTDDWHSLSSVVGVMQDRSRAIDSGEHGDY